MNKKINLEDKEVLRLFKSGLSLKELALKLNSTEKYITKLIKKLESGNVKIDVEMPVINSKFSLIEKQFIIKNYNLMTVEEIAKLLKRSKSSVKSQKYRLKKNGEC
ncbi:MAG: hypothetical protein ACRC6E_02455 [Fusobacteriaceae bacterium]